MNGKIEKTTLIKIKRNPINLLSKVSVIRKNLERFHYSMAYNNAIVTYNDIYLIVL